MLDLTAPRTDTAVAPATAICSHDLAAGAKAMLPWLTGIVPFGLVIGVSAARADIPTFAGWLTGELQVDREELVAVAGDLFAAVSRRS